jgi:hypothetical protein
VGYAVSTGIRLNSWKMNPIVRPRNSAAVRRSSDAMSVFETASRPEVGRPSAPMRFSSVVLPLPAR